MARLTMRRDALLVAALAIVATGAAADAVFRGGADERASQPRTRTNAGTATPAPEPDGPSGTLLYSDAACVVHELDVASRAAAAVRPTAEGCYGLWATPDGARFAYAVDARAAGGTQRIVLRVRERARSGLDAGPFEARSSSVVSARDGTIGWCRPWGAGGVSLEPTGVVLRLSDCPAAFTPRGGPVYVTGRTVVVGDARVRTSAPPGAFVSIGPDGSLAVVTRRTASLYERPGAREPVGTILVPPFHDRPVFAPDNCAVALPSGTRDEPPSIRVRGLPCAGAPRPWTFPGFDAAWSPDGRWIAVTDGLAVLVYSIADPAREPIRLPLRAGHIAWTSR